MKIGGGAWETVGLSGSEKTEDNGVCVGMIKCIAYVCINVGNCQSPINF